GRRRQWRPVLLGEAVASTLRPAMKPRRYDGLLLIAALLVCWQIVNLRVGADVVSSPADTIRRATTLLLTRNFWTDAASTGVAFAYACLIGIAGGMVLGLVLGLSR